MICVNKRQRERKRKNLIIICIDSKKHQVSKRGIVEDFSEKGAFNDVGNNNTGYF